MKISELPDIELLYGHKACQGCGEVLAARLLLKGLGPDVVAVVPANCLSSVSFLFPDSPWGVSALIAPFAATAAVLSGVSAALRRQGKAHVVPVGFAGDGGTADIGLQALSGAIERRDRFIYVCLDNEAYMNTGIQRSSLTPIFARTTTTPAGKRMAKKDMFQIVIAHGIEYAATCCVSYPLDLIAKVRRAREANGPTYLHVLTPCPPGWGYEPDQTVRMGRLAVQTGMWRLMEYDKGLLRETYTIAKPRPVAEYLGVQRRFLGISEDDENKIQKLVDLQREWADT